MGTTRTNSEAGIKRKIESTSNREVSTATLKDYKITFNVEREQGKVKMLNFNGFKPTGEHFSGSASVGARSSINFTPISATDVEIAAAIDVEVCIILDDDIVG